MISIIGCIVLNKIQSKMNKNTSVDYSTGIENDVVYLDRDILDSLNFIVSDTTDSTGKYQLFFLNRVPEGYIVATHELYFPDTVRIEQINIGEALKTDFNLSRR